MRSSKRSNSIARAARPAPVSHFRPHPWHGLEEGPDPPEILNVFVEITPFDLVKYGVDKVSGYLHVDRPQRSSSQPPALYGFVPRTYCGGRVQRLSPKSKRGDGDPLDMCVLSEREITDLPPVLIERLEHYFLTCKMVPRQGPKAHIEKVYGQKHALKVVSAALADYKEKFE